MSNVALDLLGQARMWLSCAGELEGVGRDEDRLAYWRAPHEFRNLTLLEQPNGTYAETLVRQLFFDVWHFLLLTELQRSSYPTIASIAEKARKEVLYHQKRSTGWIIRLGDGTEESGSRLQNAVAHLWRFTGELFDMDDSDHELLACGIGCDLEALRPSWEKVVFDTFEQARLTVPADSDSRFAGKRGIHSEYLPRMLAEMQFLQRAYPGAKW